MWEISNNLQIINFLRSLILGGIFSLFYDVFRSIRRVFKTSDLGVLIQDIIYFLFLTPIIFCFLLAVTNGSMRFYVFAGIILGFLAVRISLSILFFKVLNLFFSLFLKIFLLLKRLVSKILIIYEKISIKCNYFIKKLLKR